MIPRCPHCLRLIWPWQHSLKLRHGGRLHVLCAPARPKVRSFVPPLPFLSERWALTTPWPDEEPQEDAAPRPAAIVSLHEADGFQARVEPTRLTCSVEEIKRALYAGGGAPFDESLEPADNWSQRR